VNIGKSVIINVNYLTPVFFTVLAVDLSVCGGWSTKLVLIMAVDCHLNCAFLIICLLLYFFVFIMAHVPRILSIILIDTWINETNLDVNASFTSHNLTKSTW